MPTRPTFSFLLAAVTALVGACSSGGSSNTSTSGSDPGLLARPRSLGAAAVPGSGGFQVLKSTSQHGRFERVAVARHAVFTLEHVDTGPRSVEIRDPETLQTRARVGCPEKGGYLVDFAVARSGEVLTLTCNAGTPAAAVYTVDPPKKVVDLQGAGAVYDVSPDGAWVFGWGEGDRPTLWSTRDGTAKPMGAFAGQGKVWGFRRGLFSENGALIVGIRTFHEIGGSVPLNRIEVFDREGTPRYTFESRALDSVAFTPDSKYLALAECRKLALLAADTGAPVMVNEPYTQTCDAAQTFGPRSNALIFRDRTLKSMSLADGEVKDLGGVQPEEGALLSQLVDGKILVSVKRWKIGDEEPGWVQTSVLEEIDAGK